MKISFDSINFKKYNLILIGTVLCLMTIGIFSIEKADQSYVLKQMLGIISGLFIMLVVSIIDYRWLGNFFWFFYMINLILLLLVKVPGVGVEANNATRWIDIGIQIQPSEISKIVLILFIAHYIEIHEEDLNTFKTLLKLIVFVGIPLVLVLSQPNLSTTIITFLMFCSMLYIGGLSYKIIGTVMAIGVPAVMAGLIYIQVPGQKLLKDYQAKRILGFLNPQKYEAINYQQQNSMHAISYGQLHGRAGEETFSVSEAGFLPESHTDFIFSIIGQELGFIGCFVVVALFLLLLYQCFHNAKLSCDKEGELICAGVASLIGIQAMLNMAVTTGLMPNTGVTLPFISYGLTSLWSMLGGIGLVLNVGLRGREGNKNL